MARLPVPGQDNGTWGEILNVFLDVSHNSDGTLKKSAVLSAGAADDTTVVHATGTETIAGVKTFSSSPIVPTPTTGTQAASKSYVDSSVTAGTPDATTSSKGLVQLAGDLSGTATSPTVPGLAGKIDKSTIDAKGDLLVGTANDTVTRHAPGANGQVVMYDTAQSDGLLNVVLSNIQTFTAEGTLIVKTGVLRQYVESAFTITNVRAAVGTAPTGSSIIIDVNKNDTTIYTNQANRPTITAGSNTATANSPDVASLSAGDYLTIDVDQIGSTIAGSNLTVSVTLRPA